MFYSVRDAPSALCRFDIVHISFCWSFEVLTKGWKKNARHGGSESRGSVVESGYRSHS